MNKVINSLLFVFIFFFMITNVNAECSYQERKSLLNDAKSVDVNFSVESRKVQETFINPNSDEETLVDVDKYYFKFNVLNLNDTLFLKVYNDFDTSEFIVNSSDLKDGMYSVENDNTSDLITYYVEFYSTNQNCYAEKILSKKIKKPKENPVYYYSVCKNEKLKDNEYCAHFISKNFGMSDLDIVYKLNASLKETPQNNANKLTLKSILVKYWYLLVVFIAIVGIVITIIVVRRKRSQL